MSDSDLKQQLLDWSGKRSDAPSQFIVRLAQGLDYPNTRKLWAFIDVRREFESLLHDPDDLASHSPWFTLRTKAQKLLPILYVLPILFTWVSFGFAAVSYRDKVRSGSSEQVDFLALWSGAQQGHTGLTFNAAAFIIAGFIGLIIALHLFLWVAQYRISAISTRRYAQVSELLLDTQLHLVQSRAVTPEEMADSLTTAAGFLQEALTEVAEVLPRFEQISSRLDAVVGGLSTASGSLDSTSRFIKTAADSLSDLPTRTEPLIEALAEAPAAMKHFVDVFAQTSSEASRVNRSIVEAGSQLSNETSSVTEAIARVAGQLSDLVRQVGDASLLAAEIPRALYEPAKVARDLAEGLESATPVALVFKDGSEQMRASIDTLGKIVGELKYAAEQYRIANDQHRRQG